MPGYFVMDKKGEIIVHYAASFLRKREGRDFIYFFTHKGKKKEGGTTAVSPSEREEEENKRFF